ncbi:MAG: sulfurtransferase [Gemmatimonadales bacterium]
MRTLLGLMIALHSPIAAPVVSTAWLKDHLTDRDLVIIQVGRESDYTQGHIPGARYVGSEGLDGPMTATDDVMDMAHLPAPAGIRDRMAVLGITDQSHVVVVFPGRGTPNATRAIYLMRYAGFTNASLLDGGLVAWTDAKLPITTVVPKYIAGHVSAAPSASAGVDVTWMQAHLTAPHIRIIDARDPSYFGGAAQPNMAMAAGHIPGAENVPYSSLFDDHGLLLSLAAIEATFRAAGVQPGDTVVAYCHVGFQATVVVLAARLIGQPAKMYVGSFHDWSAHHLPTEGGK